MITFGDRLRAARVAASLTQGDVAEAIGVDASMVTRYELGERSPSGETLALLRAVFPDLPEIVPQQARPSRTTPANEGWVATGRSCRDERGHSWWYSRGGVVRVCDRCPAVETR